MGLYMRAVNKGKRETITYDVDMVIANGLSVFRLTVAL